MERRSQLSLSESWGSSEDKFIDLKFPQSFNKWTRRWWRPISSHHCQSPEPGPRCFRTALRNGRVDTLFGIMPSPPATGDTRSEVRSHGPVRPRFSKLQPIPIQNAVAWQQTCSTRGQLLQLQRRQRTPPFYFIFLGL